MRHKYTVLTKYEASISQETVISADCWVAR